MILALISVCVFSVVGLFCCLIVADRYDDMEERRRNR